MVTTNPKLLVRVLQDVLQRDQVDSYPDLAEAFKCRCARLRVPYDAGAVSVAIDRLERGGVQRLFSTRVGGLRVPAHARSNPSAPNGGDSGISRQDAAAILDRVFARVA